VLVRSIFLAGAALTALVASSSATVPSPGPWRDSSSYGTVVVSADRESLEVCDTASGDVYVEVQYATSMLLTHTVTDSNGAREGCGTDTLLIGRIDVFRLCHGKRYLWRQCNDSIWLRRPYSD
jgi:hypothetical protein